MNEHELLNRIRGQIGPDPHPVQPLRAPGTRALLLLAVWIALGVGVVALLGPRLDIATLGPWRSVGFSLAAAAAAFVLARASLRFAVPAMSGSRWTAVAWAVAALGLHLVINAYTLERSALAPRPGEELRDGLSCTAAIVALGLAPLVLAGALLFRGLLTHCLVPLVLAGLASGLAAEAAWRLRCPYSTWDHVLPFHTGALLPFMLVAALVALSVRRQRWTLSGARR